MAKTCYGCGAKIDRKTGYKQLTHKGSGQLYNVCHRCHSQVSDSELQQQASNKFLRPGGVANADNTGNNVKTSRSIPEKKQV